jgi:uncharacterized membrane protein
MTTNPAARTFSSDFKRFFVRGLVVLLPSVLTLWIVVQAYRFVYNNIAEPINGWIKIGLVQMSRASPPLRRYFGGDPELVAANVDSWWAAHHWFLDVIGVIVAIVAVYVAGRLLGGFFGRHIYRRLESFFTALPVVKQVYPYVKQVVDFLFSDDRPIKFNRVVVTEYPRKGIWSVGFLTGSTMRSIARESGDAVTIFVPSSPTPFTGYTITVPRSEVVELPITVEEAIRFAVTAGVLIPGHQMTDETKETDAGHDSGRAAPLPLADTDPPRTADGSGPTESRRDAG